MIAKHPFQITLSLNKNVVNFSLPPPLFHCHLQGRETFFGKANKIDIFERIFFLTSPPIYIKIETGCKYFTLCEQFHA